MNIETLENELFRLSPAERAYLAQKLLLSLDSVTDEDIRASWRAEAVRRARELDSGEVKPVKNGLLIQSVKKPRQNWKKEFDKVLQMKEMNQTDSDWLDAPLVDNGDWEW